MAIRTLTVGDARQVTGLAADAAPPRPAAVRGAAMRLTGRPLGEVFCDLDDNRLYQVEVTTIATAEEIAAALGL